MLWRNWIRGCFSNLGKEQLHGEICWKGDPWAKPGCQRQATFVPISPAERNESKVLWQRWGLFVKRGWNLAVIGRIEGWSQRSSQEPAQVRSSDPRKSRDCLRDTGRHWSRKKDGHVIWLTFPNVCVAIYRPAWIEGGRKGDMRPGRKTCWELGRTWWGLSHG